MLRTLFWLTWLFFYLVGCLPRYYKAKRLEKQGKKEEHDQLVQELVKTWATRLLKNIRMTLTVTGQENLPQPDEVVVFVCNHQSYMDIPVLLAGLDFPRALLSKKEIGQVPLLSGWMNQLGCLYVDRNDMRGSLLALKESEELLKSGSSLIVFPEGSRAKSDTMGEFKGGAMRMAFKTGVRIVPLAIDGSYKAFEGNNNRLAKSDVRLFILPGIETKMMSKEEQKELPAKLREIIREAKDSPRN